MTEKTRPVRTVWLERHGYFESDGSIESIRNPEIRYIVKKLQNIVAPTVGEYVRTEDAESLIHAGVTVNIS